MDQSMTGGYWLPVRDLIKGLKLEERFIGPSAVLGLFPAVSFGTHWTDCLGGWPFGWLWQRFVLPRRPWSDFLQMVSWQRYKLLVCVSFLWMPVCLVADHCRLTLICQSREKNERDERWIYAGGNFAGVQIDSPIKACIDREIGCSSRNSTFQLLFKWIGHSTEKMAWKREKRNCKTIWRWGFLVSNRFRMKCLPWVNDKKMVIICSRSGEWRVEMWDVDADRYENKDRHCACDVTLD